MSAGRRVSQFQLVSNSSQINPFDDRIPILLMGQVGQQRSATVTPAKLAEALNLYTGQINIEDAVFISGNQNISGDKNFYSRLTVNGTGVLLSGEIAEHDTGYLNLYLLKSETGDFYSSSNPSGFINLGSLADYALTSYVNSISGILNSKIEIISSGTGSFISASQTGQFYPNSNPSGFITGVDLSSYATDSELTGASGILQEQITEIIQVTGDFYLSSNPSGYITGLDLSNYSTIPYVTGISGSLQNQITDLNNNTGNYILDSESGQFYPASNPSGFITGVNLSNYATQSQLTGASGVLQTQISNLNSETGNYVVASQTGQFYSSQNPSGYITGVDLSNYTTIPYVTGVSGALQAQVTTLNNKTGEYALSSNTGNFVTSSQTGQFYANSNPSGFISTGNADLRFINVTGNENVSGIKNFFSRPTVNNSGVLLSGELADFNTGVLSGYVNKSETGQFYASSNPSGFITGIDLSSYASIVFVTGVSGSIQAQITSLDSATGSYVLNSQTGLFYPSSNPSGFTTFDFVTGVSGYLENLISASSAGVSALNGQSGVLNIVGTGTNSVTVVGSNIYVSGSTGFLSDYQVTGDYLLASQTGDFYSSANPSGFITGLDLSDYSTIIYVTGVSGSLQSQITNINSNTGNFITASQTGQFYPTSNPSGFITGVNLSSYATQSQLTGASGALQTQISDLNSQTGNYIVVAQTGQFYPSYNPSGFITGVDLSSYATQSFVTGVSGTLQAQVSNLNSKTGEYALSANTGNFITNLQTGQFYSTTNPSGYITGLDLSSYSTISYVTGVSGELQLQLTNLSSQTGNYVLDSETGLFITTSQTGQFYSVSNPNNYISTGDADSRFINITGNEDISGVKNFLSRPTVNGTGVLLSGEATVHDTGYLTGFVSKSESGEFYPNSNPSGFITGVDLSSYSTINYVTGISGGLQAQISSLNSNTGNYVLDSETGSFIVNGQTGQFYPNYNPSGFITGVDLSSYTTISYTTGVSGVLQTQISTLNSNTGNYVLDSETGIFITNSQTGQFYPITNPSGYITGVNLSSYATIAYVTGVSGVLRTDIDTLISKTGTYILSSQTGQFYSSLNPSGFITGVDLSNYSTISYVTGVSGSLQTQITSLNSSSSDWNTAYNKSVTGINISGSSDKVIRLLLQDGSLVTGGFTDLQGTGDVDISDAVLKSGDQNISGVKNFFSRPTVNGTGILLSGEGGGGTGGGASVIISDTPPGSPTTGQLWWDSSTGLGAGNLYIYFNDGTSSQWVASNAGISGASSASAITFKILEPLAVTTGEKVPTRLVCPYDGLITQWYVLTDIDTVATLDIWKDYESIPTNSNSIVGSNKVNISGASFSKSTNLSGWTTSVSFGDVLTLEVESNTLAKQIGVYLRIEKN